MTDKESADASADAPAEHPVARFWESLVVEWDSSQRRLLAHALRARAARECELGEVELPFAVFLADLAAVVESAGKEADSRLGRRRESSGALDVLGVRDDESEAEEL